jgi:hypothetical protein
MNILARELGKVLPQEMISAVKSQASTIASTTESQERLRAFMALDWLTRIWVGQWALLIPDGEKLATTLAGLPPVRDFKTAQGVGIFVMTLSDGPDNAESFVAANYDKQNFYDTAAVSAARKASSTAVADTAGVAFADAAASLILDECMAARTDVAMKGVAALSLLHCLDGVWPYIQSWAQGPGEFDAKRISIGNLAPVAARNAINPTVEMLQKEACGLYIAMSRLA